MFEKGVSGNPSGKPKGAKNKIGEKLRETISDFLTENFERVKQDFGELAPKERAKLYCDLLQYGLPKLQSVTMEIEPEGTFNKPIIIDCNGNLDERMREEIKNSFDLSKLNVEELKTFIELIDKIEIDKDKIIQVSVIDTGVQIANSESEIEL